MSTENPWLTVMGLPQWQLRGEAAVVAETAMTKEPGLATATVAPESVVVPRPVINEVVPVEKAVVNTAEPIVQSTVVSEVEQVPVNTDATVVANMRAVPLLVVWDERKEDTVAGAGSFPSGELGDLLANIVIAVGLTEDVVEAWSTPSGDIEALLLAKNLAPKSVWNFSAGHSVEHRSLQVNGMANSIEMINAPSLRELQAQKPLKGQLWRLLKPLADAGVWR